MPLNVNITGITGQTPFDIYLCDVYGESCFYINRITGTTYNFDVPPPNDKYNAYMIKIIDGNSYVITGVTSIIVPTPTITSTVTSTIATTPTSTPTITTTPTNTITPTITDTPTLTNSPTNTQTITPTNTNTATNTQTMQMTTTPTSTVTPTITITVTNTTTPTPTQIPLLLDLYPNASAAYSLRKLKSDYSGPAIRVRKNVTEIDIGFLNNVLDEISLLSFANGDSVFITTWYDQSGNGFNITQSTAINQPRIVLSGVTDYVNGKPIIVFDGSNDSLNNISYAVGTTSYAFSTIYWSSGSVYGLNSDSPSSVSRFFEQSGALYKNVNDGNGGSFDFTSTGNINEQRLFTTYYNGTNIGAFVNGVSAGISDPQTQVANTTLGLAIGRYSINNSSEFLSGKIQEIILYDFDQSINQSNIESNINTFYSIY